MTNPPPPITHEPHTFFLVFRHDAGVRLVWHSACEEGRCKLDLTLRNIERYAAVNVELANVPGSHEFRWTHQDEVLYHMAVLKRALHEGRTALADSERATLIQLHRMRFPR